MRRFGGSYELSAPTRFLEGDGQPFRPLCPPAAAASSASSACGAARCVHMRLGVGVPGEHVVREQKGYAGFWQLHVASDHRKRGAWTTRATAPLVNVVASHRLHVRACIAFTSSAGAMCAR